MTPLIATVVAVVAAATLLCSLPQPSPRAQLTPATPLTYAPPGDYPSDDDEVVDVLGIPDVPTQCHYNGSLPDAKCTPGAVNPDITVKNTQDNICNPHWSTRSLRPPTSYTTPLKRRLMEAYGVRDQPPDEYELDHLIPLALGGNPRAVENLWPQPRTPQPGFPDKDKVERGLQIKVCSGEIGLEDARREIARDFTQFIGPVSRMVYAQDYDPAGEP